MLKAVRDGRSSGREDSGGRGRKSRFVREALVLFFHPKVFAIPRQESTKFTQNSFIETD